MCLRWQNNLFNAARQLRLTKKQNKKKDEELKQFQIIGRDYKWFFESVLGGLVR